MKADQSRFTSQQVTDAIHTAFSPRWDTSLTPEEAAAHAAIYRANLFHYRQHVQRSLAEGDYRRAAEKAWGAFTQTVEVIAADHQCKLASHIGIMRVAGQLASLVGTSDPAAEQNLNQAAHTAHSLHLHFYENELPDTMVIQGATTVVEALDLLQQWFSPDPTASPMDSDRG